MSYPGLSALTSRDDFAFNVNWSDKPSLRESFPFFLLKCEPGQSERVHGLVEGWVAWIAVGVVA